MDTEFAIEPINVPIMLARRLFSNKLHFLDSFLSKVDCQQNVLHDRINLLKEKCLDSSVT